MASESKGIGDGYAQLVLHCLFRSVVKVTFRVLVPKVDGRRDNAVPESQHLDYRLETSGSSKSVPCH